MKKLISALAVIVAVPAVLGGCMGGAIVKKDEIAGTSKIAIVSVVLPRIADTARDKNEAVLRAAAERTLAQVRADLTIARNWTVLDPARYKGSRAVMSLDAVTDREITAALPQGENLTRARETVQRELSEWKAAYIGPKALPLVPRSALVGGGKKGDKAVVASVMLKQAAGLCGALNVDAVAFVHVLVSVSHPRPKTFLVSGNRTDGALRMAQTMVIVDKTGSIIADMGLPKLNGRARSRDLLPLYAGSGRDAIKRENIDLGDPGNKIAHAFSALIDETSEDMIKSLKKAAQ